MRLSRWLALIGVVVGVGCLQVSQRNALFMKGYAVGERARAVETQQTQVSWLRTRVVGLASPQRLGRVAQDQRLKLVAWSTLPTSNALQSAGPVLAKREQHTIASGAMTQPLVHPPTPTGGGIHVAANHHPSESTDDETSD